MLPNVNAISIPILQDKTTVLPKKPRTLKKLFHIEINQVLLKEKFYLSLLISDSTYLPIIRNFREEKWNHYKKTATTNAVQNSCRKQIVNVLGEINQ